MASQKILDQKKNTVKEIEDSIKNSESVILFEYLGLTVSEITELRNKLRESNATVKVYKNTLLKRALEDLDINFEGFLEGPNAILFGKNLLEPIKIISEFAKNHEKLSIKVGVISGNVADLATINEYASIPSREGLLTMLAGGLIYPVRNLAIALDLRAKQLEEENK